MSAFACMPRWPVRVFLAALFGLLSFGIDAGSAAADEKKAPPPVDKDWLNSPEMQRIRRDYSDYMEGIVNPPPFEELLQREREAQEERTKELQQYLKRSIERSPLDTSFPELWNGLWKDYVQSHERLAKDRPAGPECPPIKTDAPQLTEAELKAALQNVADAEATAAPYLEAAAEAYGRVADARDAEAKARKAAIEARKAFNAARQKGTAGTKLATEQQKKAAERELDDAEYDLRKAEEEAEKAMQEAMPSATRLEQAQRGLLRGLLGKTCDPGAGTVLEEKGTSGSKAEPKSLDPAQMHPNVIPGQPTLEPGVFPGDVKLSDAPRGEEVLKQVINGATGDEIAQGELDILVQHADGDEPLTPTDQNLRLREDDKILVSMRCHREQIFTVNERGQLVDEHGNLVDKIVLEPKPLRYTYLLEDLGVDPSQNTDAINAFNLILAAAEQLKNDLALDGIQTISGDPDSMEMIPIRGKKGIIGIEIVIHEFTTREKGKCAAVLLADPFKGGNEKGETSRNTNHKTSEPTQTTTGSSRRVLFEIARDRHIKKLPGVPDDPYYGAKGSWGQDYDDQWGLKRIGLGADRKQIWPKKAAPVIVAMIDTGVDGDHPDLVGALWTHDKEIPGNGLDDDGNGFVDDVHGWNFLRGNGDIADDNGHGTVTAGIIAARTDNGTGIAGVNPWARIMALKTMNFRGDGTDIDLARAILYATDNGARVINLSIGGENPSTIERRAVDYARKQGVVVVVAAGNEGEDVRGFGPAAVEGALTVATTDFNDQRVNFSNWGAPVGIAAPGMDILSLRARRTDLLVLEREGYKPGTAIVGQDRNYYRVSGSSFSAPFVAGVASLLLSANPKLTGEQVERLLTQSARDSGVPGVDQYTGYGIVDAQAALAGDPEFFIITGIERVEAARQNGLTMVQVIGTVDADKLKGAWVEIGAGSEPAKWQKASETITQAVHGGVVGRIDARLLAGSKEWTLRVVTAHRNGKTREGRYALTLK